MPTYQYACTDCGHEFELVQSFTEDAISICPKCQGQVRKVYSNVGVVFKGSGFYKTDSRASESKPSTANESKQDKPTKPSDSTTPSSSTPEKTPPPATVATPTAPN
jgi:putative FmdB family regulatory protein